MKLRAIGATALALLKHLNDNPSQAIPDLTAAGMGNYNVLYPCLKTLARHGLIQRSGERGGYRYSSTFDGQNYFTPRVFAKTRPYPKPEGTSQDDVKSLKKIIEELMAKRLKRRASTACCELLNIASDDATITWAVRVRAKCNGREAVAMPQ
ncbi:TPA: hypothetical protein ACSTJZ_003157 [Serratia fonticola]